MVERGWLDEAVGTMQAVLLVVVFIWMENLSYRPLDALDDLAIDAALVLRLVQKGLLLAELING